MDSSEFKRCDGSDGFASQRLTNAQQIVDKHFAKCVMCGTDKPFWKLKEEMSLSGGNIYFRCDKCGGVFSSSITDLTGEQRVSGALDFNAMAKQASGSDAKKRYIRFEEYGSNRSAELRYKERCQITIEEFTALSMLRPSSDNANAGQVAGSSSASAATGTPAQFSSIEEIKQGGDYCRFCNNRISNPCHF